MPCPKTPGALTRLPLIMALVVMLLVFSGSARAETPAATPAEPAVKVTFLKVLSSYPAGRSMPLVALVNLPEGYRLAGPLHWSSPAAEGLAAMDQEVKPAKGSGRFAGRVVIHPMLRVDPGAAPGPRALKGVLKYTLAGPDEKTVQGSVQFQAELEVSAAGSNPKVLVPPGMLAALGVPMDPPADKPKPGPASAQEEDPYADMALPLVLLLVFVGGMGLNLTPCVYPMIPITVSFFGGRAAGSRGAAVLNALVYLIGMSITYTVLGSLVALGGGILGQALTHPAVLIVIALIMAAMAASMFGFWEIRMPTALNRVSSSNRAGLIGTLIMGLTVGVIVAPCVGPFVVGLMAHVAAEGRVFYGMAVFLALSLGLGLPLAVLAVFSGSINRLPGAGEWMLWVRHLFGVILLLMAIFILEPVLGAKVFFWTFGLVGLAGGVFLVLVKKGGSGRFIIVKVVVAVLLVASVAGFLWWDTAPRLGWASAPTQADGGPLHIEWKAYTPQAMDQAMKEGRPVLVFFTADWCGPCKKLKASTLKDPAVIGLMSKFATLKVDLTSGATEAQKALARRYAVRGVPTNIFITSKGDWLGRLTVIGYRDADYFSARLKAALEKEGN